MISLADANFPCASTISVVAEEDDETPVRPNNADPNNADRDSDMVRGNSVIPPFALPLPRLVAVCG